MASATAQRIKAEEQLTAMYQEWCDAEGLPQLSADDHDHETLTEAQSRWIYAFSAMWDANDPYDSRNMA